MEFRDFQIVKFEGFLEFSRLQIFRIFRIENFLNFEN